MVLLIVTFSVPAGSDFSRLHSELNCGIFPGKNNHSFNPEFFPGMVSCAIPQTVVQYSKTGGATELAVSVSDMFIKVQFE